MTIAACYLSPEAAILGTDSTTTVTVTTGANPPVHHFLDHAQKLFEVGERSTLGIATWALASVGETSHRTLVAQLADEIEQQDLQTFVDINAKWNAIVWDKYDQIFDTPDKQSRRQCAQELSAMPIRTDIEEQELNSVREFELGFCLAGYVKSDRTPRAFEFLYDNTMVDKRPPQELPRGKLHAWGIRNFYYRLLFGIDEDIFKAILGSPKWTGTPNELAEIVAMFRYHPAGYLPVREAIDWVHSVIYSTAKSFKFSHLPQMCGGPIEVAAITSDRLFRWVHHKGLTSATGKPPIPEP